ncbi:unnamed protein product [Pelagomonas calceolata]|uniref:Uncharacterized protein n=1 Tax=Pelagomonas calceolata TaxID=35677 RepID=A0A7S4EAU2_9STRA|nr:unnamed protein product [Pelagomonas calceolata]|mmetsp:Transcript_5074/g.15296  ORF Transcript_5074/g.15296 Transcript_5074/m.15296 type:complete len:356 (+) Transcript_5074:165-1232(+)
MFSLTDLCLNRITEDPARCLRHGEETHPALLRSSKDAFLRCEAQTVHRDRWAAVEQSTSDARRRPRPEARPQLLATLAARGALVDGVLPPKFFESLRVDTLSLAACRARAPFLMLAQAQAKTSETLSCLDLGSCLQLDDAALAIIVDACAATLRRLNLRDCRKLTDSAFTSLQAARVLEDVDVGGNFNMSIKGASTYVSSTAKRKSTDDQRCLSGIAVGGLGCDDAFLTVLAKKVPSLRVFGGSYGHFSSSGFVAACASLQHLSDVRVQWTEFFDDACLDALCQVGPIRCLDCLGTAVTVDGLSRFLSLKVHDDALGPQPARLLEWVNARYTAGPRERLEKLPRVWQFAAVEVVV